MIEFIKSSNNWNDILNACRNTQGKDIIAKNPTSEFKIKLLLSEHSPIRMLNITWKWVEMPYWVSVHFSRHKFGIEHFVESQRTDMKGEERNKKTQSSLVNHMCYANAQAIINISRKRLCGKASNETRLVWKFFLNELESIEPELYNVCVPECIYRNGFCPEFKSCGFNKTKIFDVELKKYNNI